MYVRNNIQCNILQDLSDSNFEIVWIHICSNHLLRGIPCIIIGALYHPPSANNQEILDHFSKCLSIIESRFPSCGIILLCDFSSLNIGRLKHNFRLKQLVNFPTHGRNILDLILTNLKEYYAPRLNELPLVVLTTLRLKCYRSSYQRLSSPKQILKQETLVKQNAWR